MYAILGDELVASMLYEPLVRHARPESLEMIGGLQPEAALRSVYKDATRDKGTTPPCLCIRGAYYAAPKETFAFMFPFSKTYHRNDAVV